VTERLRVLLVDDEPLAIERLQLLLARMEGVELAGTAADGEAALRLAQATEPDLVLMDISMPGMDGMDAARALAGLPRPPRVVFVTAHERFAVAAFEVQAVDYLVKPVAPDRLAKALERARGTNGEAPRPSRWLQEFWASDMHGLTRVTAQDVDRVSAERDYMRLHVGPKSWLINHSMARLEAELDPDCFVRLHRSAIVRRDFVAGFRIDEGGGWVARLRDGSEQRVGRLYQDAARAMSGRPAARRS